MKRQGLIILLISFVIFGTSCTENYEFEKGVVGIYMLADANSKIIGQEVSLEVKTEDGEDITELTQIYVNGELMSSPSFSTDEVGFYEFKAVYENVETQILEVEYHDGSETFFKKRVLVEDYTGTWCGWCPRISYALGLVEEQTDDAVLVAIHRAPSGTSDPYTYDDADELELLINTPGYPKGFINRLTQWDFPEPDNISQVIGFTQGSSPKLGLKMNSQLDGDSVNLDVDALFANDYSNLKLVVYILENALVYPQVNYTSFYDNVNPIEDYVHNHTLRHTLTNIIGDEIDSSITQRGMTLSKNFNFQIPENITDIENVEFVAFLTDEEGHVINVRKSVIDENQEFELLE